MAGAVGSSSVTVGGGNDAPASNGIRFIIFQILKHIHKMLLLKKLQLQARVILTQVWMAWAVCLINSNDTTTKLLGNNKHVLSLYFNFQINLVNVILIYY